MPVVSDRDILKMLRSGELIIHPLLDKEQISGGKIDLRLDNIIYLIRRTHAKPYYDPMEYIETEPVKYTEKLVISYGENFCLHPGDYALAPLFEFVKIPKDHIGRLDGRSSLGRLGIVVHSTAGSVDPGYTGPIWMELMNDGLLPVKLYPLLRVATLILTPLTKEALRPYEGKYGHLKGFLDAESKLHKDQDLKIIRNIGKNL